MTPRHFTRVAASEGYTPPRRFRPGDPVPVHAASRSPSLDIRVRRSPDDAVYWERWNVEIDDHPVPARAWAVGCDWPIAFEVPTGPDWPAGLYLIDFDDGDVGPRSPAWFVLGDRPGSARPLLVLSTNTWNAYNQWGGRCLYSGATELSLRRPLEPGYLERPTDPDGYDGRIVTSTYDPEHLRLQDYQRRHDLPLWTDSSGWFGWERRFVRWAEAEGWSLDVALDIDLHRDDALLADRSLVLTVGHSEYWTWEMRDRMDAFVGDGGDWAIFSGNTCFWQVRIDRNDVMIGHKGSARRSDPVGPDSDRLTSMWSDPRIGRPENATIGLSFTRGGYHRVGEAVPRGAGGYTVHRPDHWMLDGTDLRAGDLLGAEAVVVGYEVDGCALTWVNGRPHPTGEDGTPIGLEIVASAPARLLSITADHCEAPEALWASVDPPGDLEGVSMVLFGDASPDNLARLENGRCVMGSFTRASGTVVNVGSTDWAYGLDDDPLVQQITANILRRLG